MELSFLPSCRDESKDGIIKSLEAGFDKDIKFLHTTTGPHRDDFYIKAGKSTYFKSFASKGQIRSSSLILKLAQMEYIERSKSTKAVLLLDDVLLDLDKRNKKLFLEIVGDKRQCFFTSTSFNEFQGIEGEYFTVKSGTISSV
jgi:DNA replication and repair protein RecF